MVGAARYGAFRHLRGGQNLHRISAAEYTPVAPIAQVTKRPGDGVGKMRPLW
jgi:hypothetical protein